MVMLETEPRYIFWQIVSRLGRGDGGGAAELRLARVGDAEQRVPPPKLEVERVWKIRSVLTSLDDFGFMIRNTWYLKDERSMKSSSFLLGVAGVCFAPLRGAKQP